MSILLFASASGKPFVDGSAWEGSIPFGMPVTRSIGAPLGQRPTSFAASWSGLSPTLPASAFIEFWKDTTSCRSRR